MFQVLPAPSLVATKASKVGCSILSLFFSMFLIAGLLAAVPITKRVTRNRDLVHSGARTTGKVVDYKMSSGKNGRIWPVVSFLPSNGAPVQFESLARLSYSGYSMGGRVPVVYDLKDPRIAEIDEPERLWGGIVVGYIVCAMFALLGGGGMTFCLRRGVRPR